MERTLTGGGPLSGSILGRRRVLCPWAVGETWKRFMTISSHVVKRAFTTVCLSLLINGSSDSEIFIKGLSTTMFVEDIKDWMECVMVAGVVVEEDAQGEEEGDDSPELNIADDELDGEYIIGETD